MRVEEFCTTTGVDDGVGGRDDCAGNGARDGIGIGRRG